jgi:hypothetical protein
MFLMITPHFHNSYTNVMICMYVNFWNKTWIILRLHCVDTVHASACAR